jgi:hypothetical protein
MQNKIFSFIVLLGKCENYSENFGFNFIIDQKLIYNFNFFLRTVYHLNLFH